jgi:hypothetical protein
MKIQATVWCTVLAAAVWGVAQGTLAAPDPESGSAGGVGVTVKAGTLGLGAEATIGVSDYLGVRLGGNGYNYSASQSEEEGTVYGELNLLTYSALLDIHPFGGGFRLSGGGMMNKNKIKLRADLNETVELDGQEYWLSDLKGEVTFNEMAPYAGIGYGNAVGADGRWHFACDFGVMFQGSPEVSASATASDPAMQPIVDDALDKEVADIQDDADSFKYYPVISLGISYRF